MSYNQYMNAINPRRRMLGPAGGSNFDQPPLVPTEDAGYSFGNEYDPNGPYNPYATVDPSSMPSSPIADPTAGGDGSWAEGASPYIAGGGVAAGLLGTALGKGTRAGQTFSGLASGAATGAGIGSMLGPGGTLIGASVGALGGALSGMFSKSPEELRAEKMDQLKKEYADYKASLVGQEQQAETTGATEIGRSTSGLVRRFKASGATRAAGLGLKGSTEAFQAPMAERAANEGSNALSNYIENTQGRYLSAENAADQGLLRAESEYALGGEIPAGVPDYLSAIAPGMVQAGQRNRYTDIMRQYYGNQGRP